MSVNAQIQALLEIIRARNVPPHYKLPPVEARANMEKSRTLFRQPEEFALGRVEALSIPGPAGKIPARLYAPDATPGRPLIVFYHGGGWVIGSLDTHDDFCRRMAKLVNAVVVAVDYRLAPEHRFPAAIDDAYAATKWVAANAKQLGGDASRLVVMGDSAGGNLAAVVALMARDQGGPAIAQQVLIYPATHHDFSLPSVKKYGEGFLLTSIGMEWFWNHYLGGQDGKDWRASPMSAKTLKGLPPAYVLIAEYDVLRDEGELYAARLQKEGVPTKMVLAEEMIHGFVTMSVVARTLEIIGDMAAAVRAQVGTKPHQG
ncbi:MAG TPA: alpha/beta hydrolase [bacterium]